MTAPSGLRTVTAEVETREDRSPIAQVEGVLSGLIEDAQKERRMLMAKLEANSRTLSKLTAARAGLGIVEEET